MPRMRGGFAELSSGLSLAQVAIRVSAAFHASSFESNALRSRPWVSRTCILLQKVHTDVITSNPSSTTALFVASKSTCHEGTGTFTCHTGNSPYKQMNTLLSIKCNAVSGCCRCLMTSKCIVLHDHITLVLHIMLSEVHRGPRHVSTHHHGSCCCALRVFLLP